MSRIRTSGAVRRLRRGLVAAALVAAPAIAVLVTGAAPAAAATFTVDDALEYHFGAEYLLLKWPSAPMALRAGVFTDHDSTIRASATGSQSFADSPALSRAATPRST